MTVLTTRLQAALSVRKNRILRVAQSSLSWSQFEAFRGLFLDEFGGNGYESELARIVAEHDRRQGKESGRPIHAGKEVPHD